MAKISADDRRALVEANLKYAYKLTHRFRGLGVEDDDLDQVAAMAMFERSKEFDPDRMPVGNFATFCHVHIVGRLRRAVIRESRRRAIEASIDLSHWPAEPDVRAESLTEAR